MLVNINNIAKRGYQLSDCVLYNGNKYKIVAIDFRYDEKDSKIFLLNGYDPRCSEINTEGYNSYTFVLYDSEETLDKRYSLWVSHYQISRAEDEIKNDNKEICVKKYEYNPMDFVNIDDKRSIRKLLSIRKSMSCNGLICSECPLNINGECAVYFGDDDAKEHLDAIIELYKTYHFRRNNE